MKKILLSSLSVLALSVTGAMAQDSDDSNDDGLSQVAGEGSTLAGNDGTNDGDDGNDNSTTTTSNGDDGDNRDNDASDNSITDSGNDNSVVNDQDQDNDVSADGDDGDNRDNDMSDNSINDSGNDIDTNDGDDDNDNSVTTTSDGDDGDNRDNDMSDNSITDSGNDMSDNSVTLTAGEASAVSSGGDAFLESYGVYQVNNLELSSSFSGNGFGLSDMDDSDDGDVPVINTGAISGTSLDSASGVYSVNQNTGVGQFNNVTQINANANQ